MTNRHYFTRSEWEDALESVEVRGEPWTRQTPQGSFYLDPDATPGLLLKLHADLLTIGFEHDWLDGEREAA